MIVTKIVGEKERSVSTTYNKKQKGSFLFLFVIDWSRAGLSKVIYHCESGEIGSIEGLATQPTPLSGPTVRSE